MYGVEIILSDPLIFLKIISSLRYHFLWQIFFYQEYIDKIYVKNLLEFYQSSWFNVIKIKDVLLFVWAMHYKSTFGEDL